MPKVEQRRTCQLQRPGLSNQSVNVCVWPGELSPDSDARIDDTSNEFGLGFHLDEIGASVIDEDAGGEERIRADGYITADERARHASSDGFARQQHLLDGDVPLGLLTPH